MPFKVGTVSGLFFGLAFGLAGIGAALIGLVADLTSMQFAFELCAFLPAIGLLAVFLPQVETEGAALSTATIDIAGSTGR
jgi:FSR family fosmidomycin resistance protein-like MFS transporter